MSVYYFLADTAAAGYELGVGRTVPTVAAVVGLISVGTGVRSARRAADRRTGAIVAVALGLVSVVVGGLHGANSAGGLGTGNGLAGAIVAVVLGLVGVVIGGLAIARARVSVSQRR